MPAPKLTPEQWNEVRMASEAGVDDFTLSEDFGVERASIRQRRNREKWLTPKRLHEQAVIENAKRQLKTSNNGTVTNVTRTPLALQVTAENMVERAKEGTLIAMNMFWDGIRRSNDRGGIQAPATAKDLLTSMKGLRLGAGLDKESVTVNIASFWGAGQGNQERETSAVVIEQ